jgi:hypothetical protein
MMECNWMTKRIWSKKLQNFEHIPSNLSGKLIRGSFAQDDVMWTHPNDVHA